MGDGIDVIGASKRGRLSAVFASVGEEGASMDPLPDDDGDVIDPALLDQAQFTILGHLPRCAGPGVLLLPAHASTLALPSRSVNDSPVNLLDAMVAAVWALTSFGFGLLSVAREVDDELGCFAHSLADCGPSSLLSRHCISCLAEAHDFASKLCGLTHSIRDSHALHRFEVRSDPERRVVGSAV